MTGIITPLASMNAVVNHCAELLGTENTSMNRGIAVVMRFWLRMDTNEPTIMTDTMATARFDKPDSYDSCWPIAVSPP